MSIFPPFRRSNRIPSLVAAILLAITLAACDDSSPSAPELPTGETMAVVVNSAEMTLTVFALSDPADRRTVDLGPEGTPVGGAVRDHLAAIPLGVVPAVALVDLANGELLQTVPLPEGSGATGAHFVNDSIVLVANPSLGNVSPVNVLRGTVGAPIETGSYPQAFVESRGRIFVVNSELGSDFQPDGYSTLTVLDAVSLEIVGSVALSWENAGGATVAPDGSVFVMNSGRWGEENGSLSIVDPVALQETGLHPGFGDFPGSITITEDHRLLASSWSFGIVEWSLSSETFVRGPGNPIEPAGIPSSAGVATDPDGRVWSLLPECQEASNALRLDSAFDVQEEVPVGICPAAILFTSF